MAKDLTLARRVQLAALAYIRHTKTRYDALLKETDWANARKAVEKPCLDIIVKWRGDEETGRDQLDEILREVIEISDSEDDSEDEASSPESAFVQNSHAMSSVPPTSIIVTSAQGVPAATGPTLVQGHRHVPTQEGLSTPARQKGMTRLERRTARKAAQRFRRYAAVADSIANEHGQDDHMSDTASRLPAMRDLTNSPASHRPVRSARESLPVTYHVRSPGHVASRAQLAPQPMRFTPGLSGETISRQPLVFSDDRRRPASPALTRISENQRPKVGSSFAQQDHSRAAVSPITTGLQDMLLPSIEPKSPYVPEYTQYAYRTQQREYQDRTEVPRIISHSNQPGGYVTRPLSRPHSRPFGQDGDERAVKRSRVTTYFPEDYNAPSGYLPSSSSFVPVSHAKVAEGSRFAPYEHSSSGVPMERRAENVRPEQPVVIATREYLPHQREQAPIRTRTNPIMVEDDIPYRPQRVFELRDRPAQDRLDLNAPRKREVVYDPALAPSRIYPVERPYHDERSVPNYRHDNVAHNYVEPAFRRLQDTMLPSSSSFPSEAHRDINRAQPNYQRVQYREIPQDHHYLRQPIERSDNIYREAHNVPRSPGQFEM